MKYTASYVQVCHFLELLCLSYLYAYNKWRIVQGKIFITNDTVK